MGIADRGTNARPTRQRFGWRFGCLGQSFKPLEIQNIIDHIGTKTAVFCDLSALEYKEPQHIFVPLAKHGSAYAHSLSRNFLS